MAMENHGKPFIYRCFSAIFPFKPPFIEDFQCKSLGVSKGPVSDTPKILGGG
jgi:ligand-binding sensor protein